MQDIDRITIGTLLDRQAERFGDRECLVYTDRPLRLTYAQFRDRVDTLARGLLALDIKKGEHVSIWASNVPEWLYLQYATAKIGAVLVTVNTAYRAHELEYLLRQSDTTTFFLIRSFKGVDYVQTLRQVLPELDQSKVGHSSFEALPRLRRIIFIGDERLPGMLKFSDVYDLASSVSPEQLAARAASLNPSDVINMQYTSGTTGFPKGVMLTHRNIVLNAYHVSGCQNLTENDRLCFPVPLFHCFGCVMASLGAMTRGATMVPIEVFEPRVVLDAIHKERCTAIYGVPTMFIAQLEHPEFKSFDLTSLRTGIMAGSPCPIEVMRAVTETMGARELTIAYGLTEASPVITQTRTDDAIELRVATVGRALPGVEVKIADPESGATQPPGTPGELCSRGHGTMNGYYHDPEATSKAIDDDRWLHSGDLAVMDERGYVKIVGRIKDMIIRGGENVYPREIEEFLYSHPKISDVQVIGVPSKRWGEEVCAVVKVKPGETLTAQDVIAFCEGQIQRQKVPALVMFVDAYPMTASGKIQKYKLREMAVDEFGRHEDAAVQTA
jgi:fatty-acyl-CoA synthase